MRNRVNNATQNTENTQENWDLNDINDKSALPTADYDIENIADIPGLFSANSSFSHHVKAQDQNKQRYIAALKVLDKNGADISQSKHLKCLFY